MSEPSTSRAAPARQEAWSRYWASGALHSCVTSYDGNYDGAVRAFWLQSLDPLHEGAACLDLGTGNGALPLLLLQAAHERGLGLAFEAVDLASIEPGRHRELPDELRKRIRFQGRVAIESLPFPDGQFSLVTAQYALEYSDLTRSVPEVARVLRPDGRLALLMHHAAARPVVLAEEELGHLDVLLAHDGLLALARQLAAFLARAATPQGVAELRSDPDANAARARFNACAQALSERRQRAAVPDVLVGAAEQVMGILQAVARHGSHWAQERLQALGIDLADAHLRLRELRAAAMDETGIAAFRQRLEAAGFALDAVHPLHHEQGDLFAWALRARRR